MKEKVKSRMKGHFLIASDPISIIKFQATFKLACDTKNVHRRAEILMLPFFEKTFSNDI